MPWLLGIVGLLLLLGLLAHLFVSASTAQVRRYGGVLLAVLGGLLVLLTLALVPLLALAGRLVQAAPLLLVLAPLAHALWRRWRSARQIHAPPPQTSTLETPTLAMRLDHASGTLSGRVKRGRFTGRELAELDLSALLELLADCQAADTESLPLLEAWLDRAHPGWRAAPPPAADDAPMDRAAALALLGLAEGASPEDIRAAHRRRMRHAHPDHGGNAELAAQLNRARDLLLG
ncbi:hypothetical protein [Pseudoroseomonas cervicalis]|uniref:hypothetical protein n=1 Tax=Teichococcus cervicalis TaxID=204525 RepID=UPI0022F1C46F|nr:hypothetical protein [Pseudoroseomonas cervicalis]WBV42452.1 hypothetical protein PFY06_14570 [Pseudoroseomonas cervicalis]